MEKKERADKKEYLHFKTSGDVDFDLMHEGIENIKTNKNLPRSICILEDARGATARLTLEEVDQLLAKMYDAAKNFKSIKHAVIHDKPENTAIALLFEHRHCHPIYKMKVFSTEIAARRWLESDK